MTLLKEWSDFIQGDYCDKHRDSTMGFCSRGEKLSSTFNTRKNEVVWSTSVGLGV